MTLQLTEKEKQLLQDQRTHEEVCIQKYQKNARQANDPKLQQLFQSYSQQEQQHMNTINSILSGQVPSMNQGQQGQQSQQSQSNTQGMSQTQSTVASSTNQETASNWEPNEINASQADLMLCNDMLMTEKYVSGAYDTVIFEFADSGVRQALNHIQKEEQQHGEGIFNYMNSNGMYNLQ